MGRKAHPDARPSSGTGHKRGISSQALTFFVVIPRPAAYDVTRGPPPFVWHFVPLTSVELNQKNAYSLGLGTASLSALLLCCGLGAWRTRVRQVEGEIVRTDEVDGKPIPEAPLDGHDGAEPPHSDGTATAHRAADDTAPQEVADDEAPQRREPEPVQAAPPAAAPTVSTQQWTCEIGLWRIDGEAVFYARSFHDGEELIVAESRPFPMNGDGPPEQSDDPLTAHQDLCNELERVGWERVGPGTEWYGDHFRRNFSVAALNTSLTTRIVFARRA